MSQEEPIKEKGEKSNKKIRFCPNCGSTELYFASGLPQMWSIWDCHRCGYRGPVVLEDGDLAKKVRDDWERVQSKVKETE